jgi:hypothetical protein
MIRTSSLAAVLAFATALLATAPALAASCPDNSFSLRGVVVGTSPAAILDTTYETSGTVWASAGWNLENGELRLYHGGTLGLTYAETHDQYEVVGVAPGASVPLTAVLSFDATITTPGCGASGCYGDVKGAITCGADTREETRTAHVYDPGSGAYVSGTVGLPVTLVEGQPVEIVFLLQGWRDPGGNQQVLAHGQIHFAGLAPLANVVSCQGYGVNVVPARRSTWGELKTRYH